MLEKFGMFLLGIAQALVNWHQVLGDADSIPPMQMWTINEEGRLVTLVDYWGIPAGSIGAVIPASTALPETTKPIWLGHTVLLGEDCCIGAYSKIASTGELIVYIGHEVNIGENVIIGGAPFNHTQIGDRVCIASHSFFPNGLTIQSDSDVKNIMTQVIRSV